MYLCAIMAKLDKITISFKGKDFLVAAIPNVFSECSQTILIGPHSLNESVYDDNKGYIDDNACRIDEQIYAYVDDTYFAFNKEHFIEKVKLYLD